MSNTNENKEAKKEAVEQLKKHNADHNFILTLPMLDKDGNEIGQNTIESCSDTFLARFVKQVMQDRPEVMKLIEYLDIKENQDKECCGGLHDFMGEIFGGLKDAKDKLDGLGK